MIRRGFTLIELIIVIVIIAILAGLVLPYFQRYVEDSRFSKARQDLNEIRNALVRYETDQRVPYEQTDLSGLIGPYLGKGIADPWGTPYVVAPQKSICYSFGPDRVDNSGDELKEAFRPPLAISRVYWEDTNNNIRVDNGDKLIVRFTRPVQTDPATIDVAQFDFSDSPPTNFTNQGLASYRMTFLATLDFAGNPSFGAGSDTLSVVAASNILDFEGSPCKEDQKIVIRAQ